jgi:pantoate--beta-alanine ligase
VSIFPFHFASDQDVHQQPPFIAEDLQTLSSEGIDVAFIPRIEDMFPVTFSTYITIVGPLAERFEGWEDKNYICRIATTMTKLLQIVRPDVAFFGQKNAQQVAIVRQLQRDLAIDVHLRILPTTRESDGLAMGSNNYLLSATERQAAPLLYLALLRGKALIEQGELQPDAIEQAMSELVKASPIVTLEYAAVCHPDTFAHIQVIKPGETLLTIAAHIGKTRLIDNALWANDGQWHI